MSLIYNGLAAFAGKDAKLRKISLLAAFFLGIAPALASAAMQVRVSEAPEQIAAEPTISPEGSARSSSASPDTAVIDCLLQREAPENPSSGANADIHINYPAFGNKQIDQDIQDWVADLADAFTLHSISGEIEALQPGEAPQSSITEDLSLIANRAPFELWGGYHITRPSEAAISIAFELWNYTGDPEGSLDILTLNYSLLTGQRLTLVDIFEKPDIALELMSAWSRKELEGRLGAARRARMLADGTEPLIDNFSSLTLTPDGICINFQPWQVAPRDAGIQKVAMPLEKLLPAEPLLALWGRGDNEPARID